MNTLTWGQHILYGVHSSAGNQLRLRDLPLHEQGFPTYSETHFAEIVEWEHHLWPSILAWKYLRPKIRYCRINQHPSIENEHLNSTLRLKLRVCGILWAIILFHRSCILHHAVQQAMLHQSPQSWLGQTQQLQLSMRGHQNHQYIETKRPDAYRQKPKSHILVAAKTTPRDILGTLRRRFPCRAKLGEPILHKNCRSLTVLRVQQPPKSQGIWLRTISCFLSRRAITY